MTCLSSGSGSSHKQHFNQTTLTGCIDPDCVPHRLRLLLSLEGPQKHNLACSRGADRGTPSHSRVNGQGTQRQDGGDEDKGEGMRWGGRVPGTVRQPPDCSQRCGWCQRCALRKALPHRCGCSPCKPLVISNKNPSSAPTRRVHFGCVGALQVQVAGAVVAAQGEQQIRNTCQHACKAGPRTAASLAAPERSTALVDSASSDHLARPLPKSTPKSAICLSFCSAVTTRSSKLTPPPAPATRARFRQRRRRCAAWSRRAPAAQAPHRPQS